MSDHHLTELLHELASDAPAPRAGAADAAWRTARVRRRRTVVATVAASAALVLGVGIVATTWPGEQAGPPLAPSPSSPTRSASPPERPHASYADVPVWWAPPAAQDAALPWLDSRLPRRIDLSPGQPAVEPGETALASFLVHDLESGRPTRWVVLTADGETRSLEADHVVPNRDPDGNGAAMNALSPDGRHLLVAQPSSLEVFSFETGAWRTLDTPDWVAESATWIDDERFWMTDDIDDWSSGAELDLSGKALTRGIPRPTPDLAVRPDDTAYGHWVDSGDDVAGTYFLHGDVPGGPIANPEGIIARLGDKRSVLALAQEGRGKGCCPVVGWIGDHVAFGTNGRVLAWRPASDDLSRVAELTGFAPGREAPSPSWAWRSLD